MKEASLAISEGLQHKSLSVIKSFSRFENWRQAGREFTQRNMKRERRFMHKRMRFEKNHFIRFPFTSTFCFSKLKKNHINKNNEQIPWPENSNVSIKLKNSLYQIFAKHGKSYCNVLQNVIGIENYNEFPGSTVTSREIYE